MNRVSEIGHSIFILTCYYSVIYVFGIPFVYSLAKKKHKTMKKKVISLFMVIALSMTAGAQTQIKEHRRSITLDEAIVIARTQSVDAAVALNELKTAYWEYRTFRANLLPEMNLKATLPSYNKKYNSYQQEDGTYTYVRNNNLQMSGELSIDQSIWFTGGTLSLNSSLDFLKQLDGDKSKRYMSVPIALTLNQPIFGVNNIKWDRRIEPVRYAEAKASFLSATENVTRTTINYFFNLELADKGTIFLDEIGDLDLSCQVKLLRVLQEQTFEVLGDSRPRKVDIRVVSATNADLSRMVREHTFREDLFYRINLITVHLPALRERREDIPLLVRYFADKQCEANGLPKVDFTVEAMEYLSRLPYPGNIRELKNLVERTLLVSGKQVLMSEDFKAQYQCPVEPKVTSNLQGMTLEEIERQTILQALEKYNNNMSQVATALGISRAALYRRLEKYNIMIND